MATAPTTQTRNATVEAPAGDPLVAAPTIKLTAEALSIEQQHFARKLAKDDEGREKAPELEMIAIAAFTRVSDLFSEESEIIQAGQVFKISAYDEARFSGKARRRSLGDPHPAGLTSNRE